LYLEAAQIKVKLDPRRYLFCFIPLDT
jgi:hypothetical protein